MASDIETASKKELYFYSLISEIKKKKPTKKETNRIKINLCSRFGLKNIPTDIEVMLHADESCLKSIAKYLQSKPARTISGVSPVAIMTKPMPCPHSKSGVGPCAMCPGGPGSAYGDVPQSYTGKEPATRRAIRNDYSPYLQVANRLEQYIVQGHVPDKVELIIMGGTFPSYPKSYRNRFISGAFAALNDFSKKFFHADGSVNIKALKNTFLLPGDITDPSRAEKVREKLIKLSNRPISLEEEHKKNENAMIRCVGLTIETRPDYAKKRHVLEMLRLGCTRVELGVQTIYDDVLAQIRRGHTVDDSIIATAVLKDFGLKVNYHIMLGLPGVTTQMEKYAFENYFKNESFMPDMLKIYPCMVMAHTALHKAWKEKLYRPLTTSRAVKLVAELKSYVPEWCRIMRVQRDIPTFMTSAGVDKTNLRQYVGRYMEENDMVCRCIRCREPRSETVTRHPSLMVHHYPASGGNEFFISAEDKKKDRILGYCRLRIPSASLSPEIDNETAIVRELHVLGPSVQLKKKGRIQHTGLGKALLYRAEAIAKTYYKKKMLITSGIGARAYYRKLGYRRSGPYMAKKL